jgi:hypothetical protein
VGGVVNIKKGLTYSFPRMLYAFSFNYYAQILVLRIMDKPNASDEEASENRAKVD